MNRHPHKRSATKVGSWLSVRATKDPTLRHEEERVLGPCAIVSDCGKDEHGDQVKAGKGYRLFSRLCSLQHGQSPVGKIRASFFVQVKFNRGVKAGLHVCASAAGASTKIQKWRARAAELAGRICSAVAIPEMGLIFCADWRRDFTGATSAPNHQHASSSPPSPSRSAVVDNTIVIIYKNNNNDVSASTKLGSTFDTQSLVSLKTLRPQPETTPLVIL